MSLNELILQTLNPLGILVRFQTLLDTDGTPDIYITFFEYNQNGATYADDDEQQTAHFIQVDLYSLGDYTEQIKQIKNLLKAVGFIRTMETEFYENDTSYYHRVLRFSFTNSTLE